MSQSHLTSSAMLSLENDVAKNVNFDIIVQKFSEDKACKNFKYVFSFNTSLKSMCRSFLITLILSNK